MRKHRIGVARPKGLWSPQFKLKGQHEFARKISGQQNTTVLSYFPTWKQGPGVVMEKLRHYYLEDQAYLLEVSYDVLTWTAQCEPVTCGDGRRKHVFRPNFVVETRTGQRVIRIVKASERVDARRSEKVTLLDRHYRAQGVTFEFLTDADLKASPCLPAAREIFHYRYWSCAQWLPLKIQEISMDTPPGTLGELHRRLGGAEDLWYQLLSMVAQGFVEVDLSASVGPEMPVLSTRMNGWRE
jgi:hypothetical protein